MGLTFINIFFSLGCILDDERAKLYANVLNKGYAMRLAYAAAIFGESSESSFWLQLPLALNHLINKLLKKPQHKDQVAVSNPEVDETSILTKPSSKKYSTDEIGRDVPVRCFLVACLVVSHIISVSE